MKHNIYLGSLITAMSLAAAVPAVADVPGITIGVDYGRTEARAYCDNITNCSDADTGPKVEVGYAFNEMLSAELGYTSFGTLLETSDNEFSASQDASAITLSGIAAFPIAEWLSLYGRAGVAWYEADNSGTLQGLPVQDDNGNSFFWGAGAKFPLTESFAIRVEFQRFTDISDISGRDDDVQALYAGVLFQL